MQRIIPLIGNMPDTEADAWIEHFTRLMPEFTVVPFEQLSSMEKQQADVAIVANPSIECVEQCSNLIWVHSLWAGVEHLVSQLGKTKLKVVRLIDPALADSMAEAVLAWSLYLHRDMPGYLQQQKDQLWHARPYVAASQRIIGLLGLGELGRASAKRLLANDFNVLGWSRTAKNIPDVKTYDGAQGLESLLQQSDIVVCLLPLTEQTYHLFDAKMFEKFKTGSSFINFARGAITDQNALLNALEANQLNHAVLDVFEVEPLDPLSPFWLLPNVTILPHISGPTRPETASRIVANNILNYRRTGVIPTEVDINRGY